MTIFKESVLTPEQLECNRHVMRLDVVAVDHESRWGIGRLPALVTAALREKWMRQQDKLNAAIACSDLSVLPELVDGTIKGWGALEAGALAAGHRPCEPEFWECAVDGVTYRITRTLYDGRAVGGVLKADGRVLSLHELVGVYHRIHLKTYAVRADNGSGGASCEVDRFKDGGEAMPF